MIKPPPINELVAETTGLMKKAWIEFLYGLLNGDPGTAFVPTSSGLGTVGTPTITGMYYRDGQFTDFYIYIVPGTSTTSTAGTTYFQLPFNVQVDDACSATTTTNSLLGSVVASTDRVFPPGWTALTTPVTIRGRVLGK